MYAMIQYNKYAIGRVIRQIRKEHGLSQEVCSGLAGIARSHLAMIETGATQPNFKTIWHIANALEIPPHQLVLYIEEAAKKQAHSDEKE